MTRKCPKSTMVLLCLSYLLFGAAAVLFLQFGLDSLDRTVAAVLSTVFGAIFLYFCVTTLICFGKTLHLSSEGCTVQFLGFSKFYPWSYYKTKLFQKAKGRKTVAISIHATLLFLPCRLSKTGSPLLWCQLLYPFSGLRLAVQPPKATKIFEADERLLALLREWNISITEAKF